MTKREYREAIERLGLNQIQAGEFLRVSERTSRNYAAHGAPGVVEMLLRVMLAEHISVEEVNQLMKRKPW